MSNTVFLIILFISSASLSFLISIILDKIEEKGIYINRNKLIIIGLSIILIILLVLLFKTTI